MKSGPVAVVDIGSNSIKVLVAAGSPSGRPVELFAETIEARISAGISRARPVLGPAAMSRGVAAIGNLLAQAAPYAPGRIRLVATSAVRGAANGSEFRKRVRAATGHPVRVLSGREEANLIGRGLRCDPALSRLRNFHVFDLGGGSLECLAFRGRRATRAISLPLGCVRMTELFVADPARPFSAGAASAVESHVRAALTDSGFRFELPKGSTAVGTGGTLTTVRAIRAEREGLDFERTDPFIPLAELRLLLRRVGGLPLARRREVPGLPFARADVFPAALATLIAIAGLGGLGGFRHSLFNLRWGVAAELLAP
jgi:exopolyphosphatase / guanosine-5'-triphosphate,3'-diphosphate pyrophosphatase